MTTTHHTPHSFRAPLTSTEVNRPLGELDAAISAVVASSGANFLNVLAYGVEGDGIANDTAAIAALATAHSGETIFFPAGTYSVGDLNISSAVDILCDPAAVFVQRSGSTNCILLTGIGTTWTGGVIDGNGEGGEGSIGLGMYNGDITVRDVTLHDCLWQSIYIAGGIGHRVYNCTITDTLIGIYAQPKAIASDPDLVDLIIDGCHIDMVDSAGSGSGGISVHPVGVSADDVKITNNWIAMPYEAAGISAGITIFASEVDSTCHRALVAHNTIIGSGIGITVEGDYNIIQGNNLRGCGVFGIETPGGEFGAISGNVISGFNDTEGYGNVGIINNGGYMAITGNMLYGFADGAELAHAIDMRGSYSTLSGNLVIAVEGYGLFIDGGDYTMVTGNSFVALGSATVQHVSSGGANNKYYGNTGIADSS